jgi:hypothetical protein
MTAIAALLGSLELTRRDAMPDLAELEATYETGPACASFWSALLEDAGASEGLLRSRPGRGIELYHDAVARHAPSKSTALSVLDARGEFQHLSFAELDSAATACASAWSLAGVEPGQVLAITLPMGVTWLIAFAAALRLGLTTSCLGSFGEEALCTRLRALEPARVVFDPSGAPPPPEFQKLALPVTRSGAGHAPPPRAYAPQQAFAKLFSPVRAPLVEAKPVSAQGALMWGLRDARFAYRMTPASGLAMPGLSFEQHQPAVILATLLTGARFVELPLSVIERNPRLLAQPFITTLGVSPALRDVLRRTPAAPLPELRDWWKSVDEPLDWPAWREFIEKNQLGPLPVSNLLVDAASGGALLLSARRPGTADAFAVPSPGVSFALSDLSSQAPAFAGSGVFSVGSKPDPKNPGWFLLVKRASEYVYGNTLSPRRAGRLFPEDEVVECAARIPGVDGACVVPVAAGSPGMVWAFVLIVFVGTRPPQAHERVRREVESRIRTRLGDDFMPDRVVLVPLHARKRSGQLDLDWCRRQYSAGFLPRKANLPAFRSLTALRATLRTISDDAR